MLTAPQITHGTCFKMERGQHRKFYFQNPETDKSVGEENSRIFFREF